MEADELRSRCCCFFGHRKIAKTEDMQNSLRATIEELILTKDVDTFLFGSKSEFDDLCLKIVTELKEKYPHIKRIYVRAEYPHINDDYKSYLLQRYEDTYYPERILGAGKAVYVERNYEMIDKSSYCVVYYNEDYTPPRRSNSRKDLSDYQPKSGTKLAYDYAVSRRAEIINVYK